MDKLQQKTFELLQIFVGICEKWDIPYYLVCGSALGAVKYEGFIPWDDDIDVGLLRQDYQRFLEVAPKELPQWCFIQNYKIDQYFPHSFSKLRNSETAFIEESVCHLPMNHGIFLDIFPLDGYPAGVFARKRFFLKKKWYDWVRFCNLRAEENLKIRIRNKVMRFFGFHKRIQKAQARLEKLYCAYPPQASELWCNYGNWQGKLEYAPKGQYGKGTWAVFEGLRVRIPEHYDEYLTQKYGDWRADLPEDKKKSHHTTTIIDTERSYREYLKK